MSKKTPLIVDFCNTFTISDEVGKSRMFNFNRLRNEELQLTIDRMKANVAKFVNKKRADKLKKLKRKDPEAAAKVSEQ